MLPSNDDLECPICMEDSQMTIRAVTPCGHGMCLRCLLRCVDRRCPLCRTDLRPHLPEREATLLDEPLLDMLSLEPFARWVAVAAVPRYNLRRPRLVLRIR